MYTCVPHSSMVCIVILYIHIYLLKNRDNTAKISCEHTSKYQLPTYLGHYLRAGRHISNINYEHIFFLVGRHKWMLTAQISAANIYINMSCEHMRGAIHGQVEIFLYIYMYTCINIFTRIHIRNICNIYKYILNTANFSCGYFRGIQGGFG